VHGHYADAGEVAALVASTMASTEACDMVMTGHSLGRNKLEHLLSSGGCSKV
jgi:sucrose-phosphate synthase